MNPFCIHIWAPYHMTEILYFNSSQKHTRLFEECRCGAKRQMDFWSGKAGDAQLKDHLENQEVS